MRRKFSLVKKISTLCTQTADDGLRAAFAPRVSPIPHPLCPVHPFVGDFETFLRFSALQAQR